jgi:hypothetical protein
MSQLQCVIELPVSWSDSAARDVVRELEQKLNDLDPHIADVFVRRIDAATSARSAKHLAEVAEDLERQIRGVKTLLPEVRRSGAERVAGATSWSQDAERGLVDEIERRLEGLDDVSRSAYGLRIERACTSYSLAQLHLIVEELQPVTVTKTTATAAAAAKSVAEVEPEPEAAPVEAVCEFCTNRRGLAWSRALVAWRCADHRPPAGLDESNILAALNADTEERQPTTATTRNAA